MGNAIGVEECKGILRYEVMNGDQKVEAYLSRASLEAAHREVPGAGSLVDFYRQHQSLLDALVLEKVSAGARHPVVVKAGDLQKRFADPTARP